MGDMPPPTLYHRMLGVHAPSQRRFGIVAAIGVLVGLALAPVTPWQGAMLAGLDAGAAVFLATVWWIIGPADSHRTMLVATREDQSRTTSGVLLLGASVASLFAVGFTLSLAGDRRGAEKIWLVAAAMLTVVLAWSLVNTVFTLRYADLYFRHGPGAIDFGPGTDAGGGPSYADFAYLAFTIGMCYQVSDTAVPARPIRRTVLVHALLSYAFGVVIVASVVNLAASLFH